MGIAGLTWHATSVRGWGEMQPFRFQVITMLTWHATSLREGNSEWVMGVIQLGGGELVCVDCVKIKLKW